MDNIFVYLRDDLPIELHEYVTPCLDGFTIYINAKLAQNQQQKAYEHALEHIERGDFDADIIKDVQAIEAEAHGIQVPVEVFEKKRRNRRKSAKIKFLESIGYDFMVAAESRYLEP